MKQSFFIKVTNCFGCPHIYQHAKVYREDGTSYREYSCNNMFSHNFVIPDNKYETYIYPGCPYLNKEEE